MPIKRTTSRVHREAKAKGRREAHNFWFEVEDLDELYELAPKYVSKKNLPVVPSRAATFMMRKFLKDGLRNLKLELENS